MIAAWITKTFPRVASPLGGKSAVVADRNVFVDAHLVSSAENGYKAESRNKATICCGFFFDETTIYGGFSAPRKKFAVEIEEIQPLHKNYLDYYTPLGV